MLLSELLAVRPGVTALAGGGGKTTAMYTLARELAEIGTVVCCTTTHIRIPEHLPLLLSASEREVSDALSRHRCICLGTPAETADKLTAPSIPVGRLAALAGYVLAEADGSRGLPVKAHLSHEPEIPPEAGQTVVLLGASGFGRPVRETVHRPEQFCLLAGIAPDSLVTPETAAAVLKREGLGDKVFVNQAETAEQMALARRLAAALEVPVFAGALQKNIWQAL